MRRLLYQGRDLDVISNAFNVDMLRQHLRTLEPGTWLNDEVRFRAWGRASAWLCIVLGFAHDPSKPPSSGRLPNLEHDHHR